MAIVLYCVVVKDVTMMTHIQSTTLEMLFGNPKWENIIYILSHRQLAWRFYAPQTISTLSNINSYFNACVFNIWKGHEELALNPDMVNNAISFHHTTTSQIVHPDSLPLIPYMNWSLLETTRCRHGARSNHPGIYIYIYYHINCTYVLSSLRFLFVRHFLGSWTIFIPARDFVPRTL